MEENSQISQKTTYTCTYDYEFKFYTLSRAMGLHRGTADTKHIFTYNEGGSDGSLEVTVSFSFVLVSLCTCFSFAQPCEDILRAFVLLVSLLLIRMDTNSLSLSLLSIFLLSVCYLYVVFLSCSPSLPPFFSLSLYSMFFLHFRFTRAPTTTPASTVGWWIMWVNLKNLLAFVFSFFSLQFSHHSRFYLFVIPFLLGSSLRRLTSYSRSRCYYISLDSLRICNVATVTNFYENFIFLFSRALGFTKRKSLTSSFSNIFQGTFRFISHVRFDRTERRSSCQELLHKCVMDRKLSLSLFLCNALSRESSNPEVDLPGMNWKTRSAHMNRKYNEHLQQRWWLIELRLSYRRRSSPTNSWTKASIL